MIQWRSKLIVLASITNLHKGLCQGHSLILLGASKVAESAVHSSLSPVRILPLPRAPLDFFLNHLSLPLLQALTSDLIASDCNEVSSPEKLSISWCNCSAKSDRSVNVQLTDGINLSGLAFNHFQSFFNEAKVVKLTFLFLKLHSATRDRLS